MAPSSTQSPNPGASEAAIHGGVAVVELVDVTKAFGAVTAVDRLSLAIAPRSFYSLLGPSGCGKTTTLRMIAGFEQPTSGEILIAGQPVAGIPPYRRHVNTVFQHYALFPHMDVARNVGYGLRQVGVGKDEERRRVDEALDLVRLGGYGRRRTWELSGGQQQRVALARALVNRPAVLLLDEPLGALDQQLRKQMQHELKSLQQEVETTFVYVTHDQEEAMTMSDVIVVMNAGRIQQQGSPRELYERPRNRFVAGFIGQSNSIPGRLASHDPSDGSAIVETPAGVSLRGRLADDTARPSPGDSVVVSIRPERLALRPRSAGNGHDTAGEPGEIGVDGLVRQGTYLGDQTEYRIETGLGELVVRQSHQSGPGAGGIGPGESVSVHWAHDANVVLVA